MIPNKLQCNCGSTNLKPTLPSQQSVGAKLESVKKKASVAAPAAPFKKPSIGMGSKPAGKAVGMRSTSLAMGLMNISANMGAVSAMRPRSMVCVGHDGNFDIFPLCAYTDRHKYFDIILHSLSHTNLTEFCTDCLWNVYAIFLSSFYAALFVDRRCRVCHVW